MRVKAAGKVFVAPLAATKPGVCQEAELSTYALLVSRHRHAIPAALFSFVVPHTIATARGLLREAASSVGLTGGDIPPVPVDQGLFRVVRDLTWMGTQAGPAEAALYLHTDLSTWCTLFCGLVSASRRLPDVPRPVLTYMESWGDRPPPEVAEGTLRVLEYGLARGEEMDRILHTARQLGVLVEPYWSYVANGPPPARRPNASSSYRNCPATPAAGS